MLHMMAEEKLCVILDNKKTPQDFMFAGSKLPDLMKHAIWYDVRRRACAEGAGELPATRAMKCAKRGLWAKWAMNGMCARMKSCSARSIPDFNVALRAGENHFSKMPGARRAFEDALRQGQH